MSRGRSTTKRDLHRRVIRKGEPPCHICGGAIDYSLPYLHPQSFVVDHIIPWHRGGPDTLDNKAAAHRSCNRDKSDRLPGEQRGRARQRRPPVKSLETSRSWAS